MRQYFKQLFINALATLCLIPIAGAQAQRFPDQPIRIVVPYQVSGTLDVVARILAQKLSEQVGQAVFVENRPGANGIIGAGVVLQVPADGYTLLFVATNHVINTSLYKSVPFDPISDFAPVCMVGFTRSALAVSRSIPVTSVAELIAYAKARPGKLNFSSTGPGSFPSLNGHLFTARAGIDVVDVPYGGAPGALSALLSGDAAFSFLTITNAVSQKNNVRVLAVTGEQRSSAVPEWPTMAEAGLEGLETNAWMALLAPARTPLAVLQRLSSEVANALKAPEITATLRAQGVEISFRTAEELMVVMRGDQKKWGEVIKQAGIKPQ